MAIAFLRSSSRQLLRKLLRSPLFTLVSVGTLALGIGANAAIFSVVHGVLLKPLPFEEPERLVGIWHTAPGLGFDKVNQSPALHFTYRDLGRVFDQVGMWDNEQASVTRLAEPERVESMNVTDGTLALLRVKPKLGRIFTPEDDAPGTPLTVILSESYWQRRFGSDPKVLGRTIMVNGKSREIVGVLSKELRFLRFQPDLFLPMQFDPAEVILGNFSYQGIARLKPGVGIDEANADVARMIPVAAEKYPRGLTLQMLKEARFDANVVPLKEDVVGDVGNVLWILLGTVGLVLLIACANVANLFLVRTDARQQELALRTALGADRKRLSRELLLESVTLGILGGLLGLALAYGGIRLLVAIGPESLPRLNEIGIDSTVLLFTFGISLFSGVLFGLFPVFKYGRMSLTAALKEGGRGGSEGRERHRARSFLVVVQIALALVLLVGSGLMIRSFQALRKVNPGFVRPEEVLSVRLSIPSAEVEDPVQVVRMHRQIMERIEAIPGVDSIGLSSSVTMDGWDSNDPIWVEDFPVPEGQLPPIRRYKWIGENYFETVGNPVLAGRALTWHDVETRAHVVVVTENLAREYWGEPAKAIGKRVRQSFDKTPGPWREIVGVVGNEHDNGVSEKPTAIVYWPMLVEDFWTQEVFAQRSMVYAIRTRRLGTPTFLDEVRAAVWSVNPNLPLANVRTLEEILENSMARTSFTLVMLGIAAGVALVLGAVGIYGVISYSVSQRTREIGVRMALGAARKDVNRLVLQEGLPLILTGLALGLVAALGLTRLMAALLFGVSPIDPVTFASVSVTLAAIALLASYLPARRAAGMDPTEALRWE
jgi:predicted permease